MISSSYKFIINNWTCSKMSVENEREIGLRAKTVGKSYRDVQFCSFIAIF